MRILSALSNMLGPEEREAVLGDLIEAGKSSRKAIVEILGLVIRRQAARWHSWRPWLILAVIIIPAGVALHIGARWDVNLAGIRTLREHPLWALMILLRSFTTLACWSVMTGAVLRSFSLRTVIVQCAALISVMLLAQAVNLMALLTSTRYPSPQDPTVAWLYETMLPWLVQILFVPTFVAWGMFLRVNAIALIGVAVTEIVFLLQPIFRWQVPWSVMTFVVYWPIAYFTFRIARQKLRIPMG